MDVEDCTLAHFNPFCASNLPETLFERPEAPDLLHQYPKSKMFIVKGNICWHKDMPVPAEDETDQLHQISTRCLVGEGS